MGDTTLAARHEHAYDPSPPAPGPFRAAEFSDEELAELDRRFETAARRDNEWACRFGRTCRWQCR